MPISFSTISFGIFLLMVFMVTVHLTITDFKSVNAQEPEIVTNNTNVDEKDKLIVMSKINLLDIEKKE
jgi:hypothetical protein